MQARKVHARCGRNAHAVDGQSWSCCNGERLCQVRRLSCKNILSLIPALAKCIPSPCKAMREVLMQETCHVSPWRMIVLNIYVLWVYRRREVCMFNVQHHVHLTPTLRIPHVLEMSIRKTAFRGFGLSYSFNVYDSQNIRLHVTDPGWQKHIEMWSSLCLLLSCCEKRDAAHAWAAISDCSFTQGVQLAGSVCFMYTIFVLLECRLETSCSVWKMRTPPQQVCQRIKFAYCLHLFCRTSQARSCLGSNYYMTARLFWQVVIDVSCPSWNISSMFDTQVSLDNPSCRYVREREHTLKIQVQSFYFCVLTGG